MEKLEIKLYPTIWTMIIAFQLLHIWFKGSPYFSWWFIAPVIALAISGHYASEEAFKNIVNYLKERKIHLAERQVDMQKELDKINAEHEALKKKYANKFTQ